jgi:hypothetical protein
MTKVRLRYGPSWRIVSRMSADTVLLGQLLTTAALIAATTDYAELVRRRAIGRAEAREQALFAEYGLRGLVRVLLADARPLERSLPGAHPG